MTKEEILDPIMKKVYEGDIAPYYALELKILDAMQEYSDLQNAALIERVNKTKAECGALLEKQAELFRGAVSKLKSQLAEKDKLNEKLNNECDMYVAELTELKDKHNFLCKQYNKLCEND